MWSGQWRRGREVCSCSCRRRPRATQHRCVACPPWGCVLMPLASAQAPPPSLTSAPSALPNLGLSTASFIVDGAAGKDAAAGAGYGGPPPRPSLAQYPHCVYLGQARGPVGPLGHALRLLHVARVGAGADDDAHACAGLQVPVFVRACKGGCVGGLACMGACRMRRQTNRKRCKEVKKARWGLQLWDRGSAAPTCAPPSRPRCR